MRILSIASLAVAASLAGGCNNNCVRERCAYPALLLLVHDQAAGDYLPEATVSQGGTPLSTELTAAFCADGSCTHAVTPPAAGQLTISLTPNYKDAFVDYVPRADACGNMVRQAITVGMIVPTSSEPPAVTEPNDLGAGCN
jgi:hypothetical protein